ncbi:hypothetical protein C8N32_101270 [Rhodovulum imhoffii]|uniref:YpeB-like protein with protease inhibitory function n=1 Tax=Rhodovulum imhoffii TaxID=365340 RepID=A0A2T5BWS4_9RHOB|nr:hypothetical protein [Rhodovulum imhoffii]MBK5933314.1 hypothetical protein [Rhodovulum imhoffii]PTN04072.1 hypothetical protein C8N32_101270 [Rhodovulum imhoffii]
MKRLTAPFFAFCLAASGQAGEIDPMTIGKIEAWLASIDCQMDPDDIEREDSGYDLDDVICKGGQQFDITLDENLNETGRRAE